MCDPKKWKWLETRTQNYHVISTQASKSTFESTINFYLQIFFSTFEYRINFLLQILLDFFQRLAASSTLVPKNLAMTIYHVPLIISKLAANSDLFLNLHSQQAESEPAAGAARRCWTCESVLSRAPVPLTLAKSTTNI